MIPHLFWLLHVAAIWCLYRWVQDILVVSELVYLYYMKQQYHYADIDILYVLEYSAHIELHTHRTLLSSEGTQFQMLSLLLEVMGYLALDQLQWFLCCHLAWVILDQLQWFLCCHLAWVILQIIKRWFVIRILSINKAMNLHGNVLLSHFLMLMF